MLPPRARSMTGKLPQIDDVAGDDDIGLAEQHHDVAVGTRAGLPDDLHGIVIDIDRPESRRECLGRPHLRGKRRSTSGRRAHPPQHVLVGEHGRVILEGERVGAQRNTGSADDGVAADMIHVGAGIDDETNPARRDRRDGFQERVRHFRRAAVDQDETVLSNVDRHVGAGAENHVDVRPDLDRFEARCDCRGMLLRPKAWHPHVPGHDHSQHTQQDVYAAEPVQVDTHGPDGIRHWLHRSEATPRRRSSWRFEAELRCPPIVLDHRADLLIMLDRPIWARTEKRGEPQSGNKPW